MREFIVHTEIQLWHLDSLLISNDNDQTVFEGFAYCVFIKTYMLPHTRINVEVEGTAIPDGPRLPQPCSTKAIYWPQTTK